MVSKRASSGGATSQYLNIRPPLSSRTPAPTRAWRRIRAALGVQSPTRLSSRSHILNPPELSGVQLVHNGNTFMVTFNEPNLTGADNTNHYVFTGGVVATNVTVVNSATTTMAQITTTPLPLGTKITLTVSGITNVVGGILATTNLTFWTDLVQTGAANWDAWLAPAGVGQCLFQHVGSRPTRFPSSANPWRLPVGMVLPLASSPWSATIVMSATISATSSTAGSFRRSPRTMCSLSPAMMAAGCP